MQEGKSISLGKSGMNRDSVPASLQETEYSFALNTIFESESGDTYNPKNEPSNILAVNFEEGFKVVGHKNDIRGDRTFYWVTNPETKVSKIGFVKNEYKNIGIDETKPLELQEQVPYTVFQTLLDDSACKCLNFDVDFPIKKIAIKDEKQGVSLYWADNRNADRVLNLAKIDEYTKNGCVDCDKLRIDKKHSLPTITPVSIEAGGQLEKGVYETVVTYCDKLGNEIADYVSITNPIHIYDNNSRVMDSTELNSRTNQAIKLQVDNLDTQYKYYKVVVVQKLLDSVSYFIEGIHPINDKEIVISTVQDKERTDINKILATKTTYIKSEGVTSSNGYLFRYGLTAEKEWNLQPISNLLGAFLRWQTVQAKEDLYTRGEASSLYRGYFRDEVYPLSWRLKTRTGYITANFPLVSRPATTFMEQGKVVDEKAGVENEDTVSVNKYNPECSTETRNKYWQFYNTAHDVKRCENFSGETTLVTQATTKYCVNEDFDYLSKGSLFLDISEIQDFTTLASYIEEYGNSLSSNIPEATLNKYDNKRVEEFLNDVQEGVNCVPYTKDNCSNSELLEEEVFLGSVEDEKVTLIPKEVEDYKVSKVVDFAQIHKVTQEGRGKRDEEFSTEFQVFTHDNYAFERNLNGDTERCSQAITLNQATEAQDSSIGYITPYYGGRSIRELQTDIESSDPDGKFTNRVHKGALWIKSKIEHGDKAFIEIPKWKKADFADLFHLINNHHIRISIFSGSCNNLKFLRSFSVDVREGAFIETPVLKSELVKDEFYVAIDFPIKTHPSVRGYVTAAINGVFGVVVRAEEFQSAIVTFDKLYISKQQKYRFDCEYEIPLFDECKPQPYESGKFAYWESTETYPDNKELYDSSSLKIKEEDLPEAVKNDFEEYFASSKINGTYVLKEETNLSNKPIRHFKFPDFNVAPFMTTNLLTPFSESYIFPLGVTIDKEVVNSFLDIAVNNNLITQEQRDSVESFELFRGDRRVHKSVLGKGIAFDMYEYEEPVSEDKVLFSNFPYNDLGDNQLMYSDDKRNTFIKHPYNGNRNNRFSIHSPEYDQYDINIGGEAKVEAFQYGASRGRFVEVKDHPTWVILGDKTYKTATTLAILEYSLETAIRLTENVIQSSQNYWFQIGTTIGGNPAGAITSTVATAALTVFEVLTNAAPVVGRYRYEWLKVFRDLGKPENFAYQYSSEGFYNFAEPNSWHKSVGNSVRAISTGKRLGDGKFVYTEKNGDRLKVNNLSREKSLLLTFGEYPIEYPTGYKTFDNGNIDSYGSSRTTQSESGSCTKGQGEEIQKNIASPYVAIKNYVPFQYGSVSSIKWLPTSREVKLNDGDNSCYAIFGGDIFISRYTLKRKTPLFNDTAFGLAPLLPYEYYKNSNLGYARFYCDYETGGEENLGRMLFPDFKSDYSFDCQTPTSKSYIKQPSKFYLNYYGIPSFLVESEINLNLRYGKKDPKEGFYPEVGDHTDWTQEKNVSIREPNHLFYNDIYSSAVTVAAYRTLPDYYSKKEFNTIADSPNGVIYSMQDNSENDLTDPWIVYKPLDKYQFPTSYGKLKDLTGIESGQVFGRFENTSVIFNAVNQYKDAQDAISRELGTGGVFAARPMEFSNTELGYGGTNTYQLVSNEYGHFYVDAERGQIFQTTGKNLQEISAQSGKRPSGMKSWFKEHLPFKIKDSLIKNYESIDTDNALNGVGITMGWDSKFDRLLVTKIDYTPLQEMEYQDGKFYVYGCKPIEVCRYENKEQIIQDYVDQGYKFIEEECRLVFQRYNETCGYQAQWDNCEFPDRAEIEQELVSEGYSFKEQVGCELHYEKVEEVCDDSSKQAEINALIAQGYTITSQNGCEVTLTKDTTECSFLGQQSYIYSLMADGYVLIDDSECRKVFEKDDLVEATNEAVDDFAEVNQGESININVVANDRSGSTQALIVDSYTYTQPSHGTLELINATTFKYTHDGSSNFTDTFTYAATNDLGVTDPATVYITIYPSLEPQEPEENCRVHFSGILMSDQVLPPPQSTEDPSSEDAVPYTKIYVEDDYSEFVGAGNYPDNEVAFPKSIAYTFDGVAIDSGTRLRIYSGKNFTGELLLDLTGPALLYNNLWKTETGFYAEHYRNEKERDFSEPLQSVYPQSVRQWSSSNMHEWKNGSAKITCED